MAIVAPYTRSAQTTTAGGVLEIRVPAPRMLFAMLFLPVWLVGWAFGLVSALRGITNGPAGGQAFLGVWLVGWVLGGGFALVTFFWMLAGKQIIRIGHNVVSVRWDILGLGYTREYDARHIQRLRLSPQPELSAPFGRSRSIWGWTGGPLAFDYGSRTVRIGSGLDEAEARELLPQLQHHLPGVTAG